MVAAAMLAAGVSFASAQPDTAGDPVNGRRIAATWCDTCHVVPGAKIGTSTGAPAFSAIAANASITPLSLRAFLQTPHQRMPDWQLTNSETDDLIAFILASRVH